MNHIFKLLILIFFSTSAYSQSQDPYPHLLVFKDGTELRGKAVQWNKNKIVFRLASNDEKQAFKYKILKSVKNRDSGTEYDGLFVLRQLEGTNKTLRLTKTVSGKVECFYIKKTASAHSQIYDINTNTFSRETMPHNVNTTIYYIGRQDDDFVVKLKHGPRFKKFQTVIDAYFKDCPDVISKIEEGYFDNEIETIEAITTYYNTKC